MLGKMYRDLIWLGTSSTLNQIQFVDELCPTNTIINPYYSFIYVQNLTKSSGGDKANIS